MFGWCKKITDWLTSGYENLNEPTKKKVIILKDLKSKTKKELERIGRKMGIELDRRLSKSKLINKIKFKAKLRRGKR